ncbi:MAG TPA: FRG domain-containing protein [Rubricoccaceae bacterium]|nr:FRG domain-containing protein [Rubricoccaceae bacterium]
MRIREETIHTLGALIDAVTPEAPDPETGHRRDTGVYHGASDAAYPLLTTLDRLGGTDPPHTKAHLEAHVLRNFARYARPHLGTPPANDWELLVVAQHHGVPTRLLDWSYSPLVAAHFATCAPRPGRPCAVWRLDWQRVHRAFGLPELALLIEDLRGVERLGGEGFTPWALFDGATPAFACMIEPPSLDARIVAQAAVFTLCSDATQPFEAFLDAHGLAEALTKLVIPPEAVALIRDQLDLAGMGERRLFPDLDGVAAAIRRYYA